MILIDFSNIAVASFMAGMYAAKAEGGEPYNPNMLRHMILNAIRYAIKNHADTYANGGVFLCVDSSSWRKERFPNYKAKRAKNRDKDGVDWDWFKDQTNQLLEDIRANFPVHVVKVERAEADDIIATICRNYGYCRTLIVSGDEDFYQLHSETVQQYAPVKRAFIKPEVSPAHSLHELIVKGDTGDGVPNIRSADDVFLTEGTRQSPITAVKLAEWLGKKPEEFCDSTMLRNYHRNQMLVDFSFIPKDVSDAVITAFEEERARELPNLAQVRRYLIEKSLLNLMEGLMDFGYATSIGATTSNVSNSLNV